MSEEEQEPRELWLWCDLETTGLNPESGEILETSFNLMDPQLGTGYLGANEFLTDLVEPSEGFYKKMNAFVFKMHTDNGLIIDLLEENFQKNRIKIIDEYISGEIDAVCENLLVSGEKCIIKLAGSSVDFDKGWIKCHMPRLYAKLYYRVADVSSMLSLFTAAGLSIDDFKAKVAASGGVAHRAEADLRTSISSFLNMKDFLKKLQRSV